MTVYYVWSKWLNLEHPTDNCLAPFLTQCHDVKLKNDWLKTCRFELTEMFLILFRETREFVDKIQTFQNVKLTAEENTKQ